MSQVIKKRKIVIASVLKPVDDTRMHDKLGATLSKLGEVIIFGYPSDDKGLTSDGIKRITSRRFSRVSMGRVMQPTRLMLQWIRMRPTHLVVTTHELLFAAVITRVLTGARILCDIRENYYRNIRFLPTFPPLLRLPLALFVRLKEIATAPLVHQFILSDSCYVHQLPFIGKRFTILENKVCRKDIGARSVAPGTTLLCFTGTLAESTGIFTAIHLAKQLHAVDPSIQLTIAGYCSSQNTLQRIRELIDGHPFIQLIGGEHLIPHRRIIEIIQQASLGIITYPPHSTTSDKLPTKMYEYLANRLPILLTPFPKVERYCAAYPAALVTAAATPPEKLYELIRSFSFYQKLPGSEVVWESQAEALIALFD